MSSSSPSSSSSGEVRDSLMQSIGSWLRDSFSSLIPTNTRTEMRTCLIQGLSEIYNRPKTDHHSRPISIMEIRIRKATMHPYQLAYQHKVDCQPNVDFFVSLRSNEETRKEMYIYIHSVTSNKEYMKNSFCGFLSKAENHIIHSS